jgi:hypothetical protein
MDEQRWTAPKAGTYHFASGMEPHLASECTEGCLVGLGVRVDEQGEIQIVPLVIVPNPDAAH